MGGRILRLSLWRWLLVHLEGQDKAGLVRVAQPAVASTPRSKTDVSLMENANHVTVNVLHFCVACGTGKEKKKGKRFCS